MLPGYFARRLDNVEVVVEERPTKEHLESLEIPDDEVLYGMHDGVPITERHIDDQGYLPNKVILFYEPLVDDFPEIDELRDEVHITLLHEIGHALGLSEEELDELGYG